MSSKLLIVELESLDDLKCSIDLNEVFSIETSFDEGEQEVQLIAWMKNKFAGDDSSDFYIVDLTIEEDDKLTYREAVEEVSKCFKLIMDFWQDDSKSVCHITDATLRGYIPKVRINPFE